MALAPGTRIGSYEILSTLGSGGMGEVYRARDVRLDRLVAIKSLPEAFASDPERLARFGREAKLLASVNHPHIASIYGLVDLAGTSHLVLEFVDGETLATRLARGPLPIRETLEVGGQIAAAIEAAHERGIVHRDLKPQNVMLVSSRGVKVLDFGLAKGGAMEPVSSSGLSMTPTVAMAATAEGIILGTAPYMSPEQARGKAVDRRTDVWAFGCILYECVTGRPGFAGETVSDVIARILEREPDWSEIPASIPERMRSIIRRCLTKDPASRPRDIGDLRLELSAIATELSSAPSASQASAALPSLAVLYFDNLARDSESEYFCAGITEDILTDLSKIKGLRVASRNASARYRGTPTDIPKVAAELGVGNVLEGSVRRAGDRVRISAQLIKADGFHVWAERYDRTLQDVFAVQEEIASSIAQALRVALTPSESNSLVQDRPHDVRAYDLYLKGRQLYGSYTADSIRGALELFRQAIAIDSQYALAWAGVADCYGQMNQYDLGGDADENTRRGLEAARQAIALNPKLAEAYKAEALVLRFAGDVDGSRASLIRALEANPRLLSAMLNLGVDAFSLGNLAGTERLARRAMEIDPQDAFATVWLSILTHLTERHTEAAALAHRIRELSEDPVYVRGKYISLTWSQVRRGDLEALRETLREGRAEPSAPDLDVLECCLAVAEGRMDEAKRLLRRIETRPLIGPGMTSMAAAAALRLGEPQTALSFLGRHSVSDFAPILVRLDPALHPLLDHAPFAPRRLDATLIWPLEAPMIDAARYGLFREVRIESGRPQGSDIGLDAYRSGESSGRPKAQ